MRTAEVVDTTVHPARVPGTKNEQQGHELLPDWSIFTPGLPASIPTHLILKVPGALEGRWIEWKKRSDVAVKIMQRLGIGGIKRRLVANRSNEYELYLKPERSDPQVGSTKDIAIDSTTNSSCNTPTRPSSPLSTTEQESLKDERPTAASAVAALDWWQKQYLPMNRSLEESFTTDGITEQENKDPETGLWKSTSIYRGGMIIQKRVSEQHGVTLFETRAALRVKTLFDQEACVPGGDTIRGDTGDPLDGDAAAYVYGAGGEARTETESEVGKSTSLNGLLESLKEVCKMTDHHFGKEGPPCQSEVPIMYFQWKLVEFDQEDLVYDCFLIPKSPLSSS